MCINKVFRLAFILFIAGFTTETAHAQILHVEQQDEQVDSLSRWSGELQFNLVVNNQGADAESDYNYLGLTSQLNLGYLTPQTAYLLLNYINYMSTPESAFISNGYSHFRINFLRKRKLSYETFAQLQYDASRGLKRRSLGGAGLRYRLYSKGSSNIYAGSGLMYENEVWNQPNTEEGLADIRMLKTTNYLSADVAINKTIHLNSTAYYQTGYHQEAEVWRHRLSMDAELEFQLTKRIEFNTTFSSTYENRPIIPIRRFIYTFTNGISVSI